ncbi:cytochrome b561 domain-containing protein [Aspergillus undulatus]|uniref:cytochrome b561 domain-containing protein n=1 Tax=Aspergillus undulatus TaxID=1810928 RepID=UPI003CCD6CCB
MDRSSTIRTLRVWAWFSFAAACGAQNAHGPPQLPPGVIYEDLHLVPAFAKAHGLVMGIAFAIIFPLGAILLRVIRSKYGVYVHIGFQLLAYVLMIAGLATGIRVGKILDRLHNNGHTILGTVIVVFLLIQPFIGFWHHYRFKKTQAAGIWTHIHIWLGRIFILLGIINGGTGLKLADNTTGGIIAYGVVAGVFGVAYVAIAVLRQGKVILKEKETTPETAQI